MKKKHDELQPTPGVRLQNADVFQITAYALEYVRKHPGESVTAALVYPVLVDVPTMQSCVDLVGGQQIRIALIGWNVSKPIKHAIDLTLNELTLLRNGKHQALSATA